MKAEVARLYTNKANSLDSRMVKIYEIIRKASEHGIDFFIFDSTNRRLADDEIKELVRNGYGVLESKDPAGGKMVTIEW
jgi:hypothetical protein